MAGYNYMNGGYYAMDRNKPGYAATSTERVVEHVLAPVVVTENQYISQAAKVESMKNYGVTGDKWRKPPNPAHDRPQVGVIEIGYGSPTKVEPMKDAVVTGFYRPPEVEEFVTKVQTEASRPTRPGVLSATNWRNMPNGNTIREPTMTSKEGWEERPSRHTPLSGPTNDIGKAVEMLKEAVKPSPVTAAAPPQPRFAVPASTVLKRETYTEVIDSREAARRYSNSNQSSRPFQTGETHTGTINSTEAAQKYNGRIISGPKGPMV